MEQIKIAHKTYCKRTTLPADFKTLTRIIRNLFNIAESSHLVVSHVVKSKPTVILEYTYENFKNLL